MQNRTGLEPKTTYSLVGPISIRADHRTPEFITERSTAPHEDGTVKICEMYETHYGCSVWGENVDGQIIWFRENDAVAQTAVDVWMTEPALVKALAEARANSAKEGT